MNEKSTVSETEVSHENLAHYLCSGGSAGYKTEKPSHLFRYDLAILMSDTPIFEKNTPESYKDALRKDKTE